MQGEPDSRSEGSVKIKHEINPALYQENTPKCEEAVESAIELCEKMKEGDLKSIKILREKKLLQFCTKIALENEIGLRGFSLRKYADKEEYATYFP